jgi:hypothetical protein
VKRDPRLRALSRDHHHALVLARFIAAIDVRGGLDEDVVTLVKERFASEIFPHFEVEELLLSALAGLGADELVTRTRDDHAKMMQLVERATATNATPLTELAALLTEHVRFEERELYPACEDKLPAEVLERVARAHGASAKKGTEVANDEGAR